MGFALRWYGIVIFRALAASKAYLQAQAKTYRWEAN